MGAGLATKRIELSMIIQPAKRDIGRNNTRI